MRVGEEAEGAGEERGRGGDLLVEDGGVEDDVGDGRELRELALEREDGGVVEGHAHGLEVVVVHDGGDDLVEERDVDAVLAAAERRGDLEVARDDLLGLVLADHRLEVEDELEAVEALGERVVKARLEARVVAERHVRGKEARLVEEAAGRRRERGREVARGDLLGRRLEAHVQQRERLVGLVERVQLARALVRHREARLDVARVDLALDLQRLLVQGIRGGARRWRCC